MNITEFKEKHKDCKLRVHKTNTVDVDNSEVVLRCDYHGEELPSHVPYGRFCHFMVKCVGRGSCPREFSCCD